MIEGNAILGRCVDLFLFANALCLSVLIKHHPITQSHRQAMLLEQGDGHSLASLPVSHTYTTRRQSGIP